MRGTAAKMRAGSAARNSAWFTTASAAATRRDLEAEVAQDAGETEADTMGPANRQVTTGLPKKKTGPH